MEEAIKPLELAAIKKKSFKGVVALTSRTFLLQIIAFAATFFLTLFLSPEVFGIFYVVSAIIAFLGYFSDIGLAAALIQKKDDVSREDLATTFTIQQLLVGIMVACALAASGWVAALYKLDESGLWLLRSLIVAFFLSSLKTIPSVLLERALSFEKLVIPQILETLGFYVTAVVMAWMGYGIASFTWAVLVRAVVGLIAIYLFSPWVPRIGISKKSASRLLRFGIPFQLNSFLALLKDDLLTVALGILLPFSHVGYIGWAKKWAEVPLRLIMDSVVRVTFPTFSRIQHMKDVLGSAIEKTLFGITVFLFPITVGLLFFVEPLVSMIPKYGKWEPALMSFYLFCLGAAVASISVPLTNALNAVGRIKITLGLMIGWTITTWIFTVIGIQFFGYNGYAAALLVVSLSLFIVVALTKRVASFSVMSSIAAPLFGAGLQAFVYALLRGSAPFTPVRLILVAIGGVILYGSAIWALEGKRIRSLVSLWRT